MIAFDRRLRAERRVLRAARPRSSDRPVGQANGKAGYALAFPVFTCRYRTAFCQARCYACRGSIAFPCSIAKAVANYLACDTDPLAFASRVAAEFARVRSRGLCVRDGPGQPHRVYPRFVRWNASGDLWPRACLAILALARRGIIVHVFTRDAALGTRLRRAALRAGLPVVVLFSVDPCTSARDRRRWRGTFAAAVSASTPYRLPPPIRCVAFAIDGNPVNVAAVPEPYRSGACPCDLGSRPYLDSCRQCLEAGAGCWMRL